MKIHVRVIENRMSQKLRATYILLLFGGIVGRMPNKIGPKAEKSANVRLLQQPCNENPGRLLATIVRRNVGFYQQLRDIQ